MRVARASPSLFDVLRVTPALGRAFDESEAILGNDRVTVLSHALWNTRFGSLPEVIGRDIRLDGETFRVIGVMPEGFELDGAPVAAWVPFAFTPQQMSDAERGMQYSLSIGRLRPGATLEGLNAELDAIVQRNVDAGIFPQDGREATGFTGRAQSLRDFRVGDLESMLLILQATIIGVVPAVQPGSLADDTRKETVYWHYLQRPVSGGAFALRTVLPPEGLTRATTAAIATLDPELALFDVRPMETRVTESLGPQRAPMVLTLVFAGVAFTLAVIGVYGVLNWAVTQRYGEIGMRVALGAQVRDIVRMVLGQGGRLVVMGAALGVVGAIAVGAVLSSQIRNVSAIDPAVISIAVAALAAAALLASWIPARRAGRIDPMRALRDE